MNKVIIINKSKSKTSSSSSSNSSISQETKKRRRRRSRTTTTTTTMASMYRKKKVTAMNININMNIIIMMMIKMILIITLINNSNNSNNNNRIYVNAQWDGECPSLVLSAKSELNNEHNIYEFDTCTFDLKMVLANVINNNDKNNNNNENNIEKLSIGADIHENHFTFCDQAHLYEGSLTDDNIDGKQILRSDLQNCHGLSYDPILSHIYYSDIDDGKIFRFKKEKDIDKNADKVFDRNYEEIINIPGLYAFDIDFIDYQIFYSKANIIYRKELGQLEPEIFYQHYNSKNQKNDIQIDDIQIDTTYNKIYWSIMNDGIYEAELTNHQNKHNVNAKLVLPVQGKMKFSINHQNHKKYIYSEQKSMIYQYNANWEDELELFKPMDYHLKEVSAFRIFQSLSSPLKTTTTTMETNFNDNNNNNNNNNIEENSYSSSNSNKSGCQLLCRSELMTMLTEVYRLQHEFIEMNEDYSSLVEAIHSDEFLTLNEQDINNHLGENGNGDSYHHHHHSHSYHHTNKNKKQFMNMNMDMEYSKNHLIAIGSIALIASLYAGIWTERRLSKSISNHRHDDEDIIRDTNNEYENNHNHEQ